MTCPELFSHIADRVTLVVGAPYNGKELTVSQLENIADSLTVFMGALLAEARSKNDTNK